MSARSNACCIPLLLLSILSIPLALIAGPALAAGRPSASDFVSLAAVADLAISRDGRFLAYAVSRAEADTSATPSAEDTRGGWKRTRRLELLELSTGTTRTLTAGEDPPGSPAFSPDGLTLGFLRKGSIWLLPLAGGEAVRVDTGKRKPESFRFSPDGRSIAFVATDEASEREIESEWRSGGAFEWESQWRNSRLWIVPATGGTVRAASPDSVHITEFEWAPDGLRLAALTSRSSDPYQAFNFLVPRVLDAREGRILATLERKTDSFGSAYGPPVWTPDGKSVLMTGLNGGLSNANALLLWNVATGQVRDLAPHRDFTFAALAASSDGRSVFAALQDRTETRVLRFAFSGGAPQDVGFRGRVAGGALIADPQGKRLFFLSSTPAEPSEVTEYDLTRKRSRVLTQLHPEVAGWPFGRTEVVRWTCPEGVVLEGLLTRPPGATSATPLVVLPHGGPDGVSQAQFSSQVQYLATRGYAVFNPNYRGGVGYGFAFYEANRGRLGDIEQMDIESGVDSLIARGLADPDRLFYGGWSWGGYLSAWTLGHVQRYRAFVVGAGVNDVSFSYTSSDINHGVASQWEYRGDPWRQTAQFDRANPVRYAKDMHTPTLILHGQADDRVHFLNGLTLYRALVDVGTPVQFFAYPREPHGFTEPAHLVHRLETWARWYDEHGGAVVARP